MKISAKHAQLIRQGIDSAKRHTLIMKALMEGHIPYELTVPLLVTVNDSIPDHPLSIRAYIRTVDKEYERSQRKLEELRKRFGDLKASQEPAVNLPEAPVEKTTPRIADGFHD